MRTLLAACSLVVSIATLAPAPARAQAFSPDLGVATSLEMYQEAVAAFREHRYSAAYGRFMRLADAGHEASAQMALTMFRNGPALFNAEWDATEMQLARWSALVVATERESNDYLRLSAAQ